MKHFLRIPVLFLAILTILILLITPVKAEPPVVHAVLFYSQSCPHCHQVINEVLPPLFEKYSDQLVILGIDTYTEQGHGLYQAAIQYYQIPPERLGVPTLIVGDTILVGSLEIPQQLPALIEDGLAAGGINWPDFPALQKLLEADEISDSAEGDDPDDIVQDEPVDEAANAPDAEDAVQEELADEEVDIPVVSEEVEMQEEAYPEEESPGIGTSLEEEAFTIEQLTLSERFARDPIGNTISVIVLVGMVFSVIGVGARIARSSIMLKPWPIWGVPVLVLIGLVVAIYMGYVEVTETDAVCGPVGDCNTVQQSSYTLLFGIIPIGVFGVVGYLLIGIMWLLAVFGPVKWQKICALGLWLLSLFGALFSIYLTFLEPFVIGATCAWCLTSAIVMHLLLWAATVSLIKVWNE